MISKMADSGAENLRKQIAFLSNLIDSHKNDKQNDKPVVKNIIPNSKQNKTWTRWKSESALNKSNLNQNKQPSQRGHGHEIVKSQLSRTVHNVEGNSNVQQSTNQQKSNPSMKYKLHTRKLTSTKSASAIDGHASKTTVLTKTPLTSSSSVTKTPFKMVARAPSSRHSITKQSSGTLRQPKGNLTWTKNEKKSTQIENLKSTEENKMVSSNTKTLTKNPLLNSFKSGKPFRKTKSLSTIINRPSSSSHLNTTPSTLDRRTVVSLKSAKPLTKATSLHPLRSSDSNKTSTSDQRTVALPKASKPLTKTMSFHSNSISTSTTLDRRAEYLPKSQKTASNVVNNSNISTAKSTTGTSLNRGVVHLPRSHILTNSKVLNNTSNSHVQSTTSLDRRTTTLPKSHRTPLKVSTETTKSNVPNATITKGAKLKWRRKSASQLRNDSVSKNPRSKNLFGKELQTRIALKAKWRKAKTSSTTLRKAVSSAGHSRISVNRIPKNAKSKGVFHSPYTKNILQSRTIPRRSRLKWSKSLSQSNLNMKSDQPAVRSKAKFAHNSRFCLKRRKSIEGKVSGVNTDYLGSSPVKTGAKVTSQNKGFVARRMKYIARGSQTQNRSFTSKHSLKTNVRPQLKRKIKIGGSVYLISSHGKSLKKTIPSKDYTTMFSSSPRRHSLHVYRRPSVGSSTNTVSVNRIFKRQNSVDKNKTRKANKILKRTLQNVQAVMRKVKKQKSKSEEYCMFYNKFGKCTKHTQGKCPYIHDPTKIAVCTRFLRGKCQQMDGTCPFSHKIDKEKMPICQYFLKGKCNRDDCPYSHVNVGRQAVVCEDFLKGYCALGIK
ncbi:zinc finger CCCH domain-containing 3-like, partial [Paramuricea clavata]